MGTMVNLQIPNLKSRGCRAGTVSENVWPLRAGTPLRGVRGRFGEPSLPTINRSHAGFSMIEVLVAASILVVIVMMLGMLFQQTSLAWRSGSFRAEAYMQVRSYIGAIQRDASAAVDARFLPQQYVTEGQQFSEGRLIFYTLTGGVELDETETGGVELDETGNLLFNRSLKKVTYDTAGNRTEQSLKPDGSWGAVKKANVLTFAERQSSKNRPGVKPLQFTPHFGQSGDGLDSQGLPLHITFGAQAPRSTGNTLDIGAWSWGPDGRPNTTDDIKTWVEE